MKEEWKIVPKYTNLWASNLGNVAEFNGSELVLLEDIDGPGYFNEYLANVVIGERGGERTELQHILIAKAFLTLPETYGIDEWMVNHKDGDKRNNVPTNLEWVTRSENLRHSYEIGLRGDACTVVVTNHKSGESIEYYTMTAVGRALGITKNDVARYCNLYRDKLWNDTYTFHRDVTRKITSKHSWVKTIFGFNYSTNELHVATDSAKMEYVSKVPRMTILWNLREHKEHPVNGWVFRYDPNSFPVISDAVILESIEKFKNKPVSCERVYGVEVKDYRDGSITTYSSFQTASDSTGTAKAVIAFFCQGNTMKLVDGRIYRKPSDEPFPDFSDHWIKASIGYNKECKKVIEVYDLVAETTAWYPTFHVFAKETSTNAVAAANSYRSNKEKPFMKRYLFKELTS